MEFDKRKAATIAAMASTSLDKSPKGTIDAPILTLLKTLNLHPSFFTTSSCSGRISVFSHPSSASKKAKGGTWIFITHDPSEPAAVVDLLFPSNSNSNHSAPDSDLVFRFEPLIIAVECKDVPSAQLLVSLAISSGFRESGITSVSGKRVMVAVRCSIRLEVPLGSNKELLVSRDYVRYLVELANAKMEANRKRADGFLEALRRNGFPETDPAACEFDFQQPLLGAVPHTEQVHSPGFSGLSGIPTFYLAVFPIKIVGESVEKLFLWGHSSCMPVNSYQQNLLIYGGFGGLGRHARRSECLLLDPIDGTLTVLNTKDNPSPRLGHTCSLVGDLMFIIGGRADPVNILNDVWIFNTATNEWKLAECTGSAFHPRHRHSAAVVGSKIYVYGGLNNDTIYSSMLVLDVANLQWEEVHAKGEWPCARHSHSMVAYGSRLYMFGGYSGEKTLGDLLSFDIHDGYWEKVKADGRPPYPRFSHSMFTYKGYLGIVGGCPVRQHCQELTLFDMRLCLWKHVMLKSFGKDLFVRSSVNVVADDLIVIGGGASCYAFGTKFSKPVKINLFPLMTSADASISALVCGKQSPDYSERTTETKNASGGIMKGAILQLSHKITHTRLNVDESVAQYDQVGDVQCWVLKLEKKYGKLGKDILKHFRWLDLGRKVYSSDDGSHICFPVTEKFCAISRETLFQSQVGFGDTHDLPQSFKSLNEVSCSGALNILLQCGATILADKVAEIRKGPKSPLESMKEAVASIIKNKGLSAELLEQLPTRWEKLGDIVVLPEASFKDPVWNSVSSVLWPAVARCLGTRRLARQGRVAATGTRDSQLEILLGENGWVEHRENGILYSFDASRCMFSWGNLSEKLRMACLDCKDEVIVDLFSGIGYFVLPFLVRANAKLVYACEWNPHAIEALRCNLEANSVVDRCIVLEGDNRLTAPKGVANRVCLGLIPSSEGSWLTAFRALRDEGGILHIHSNVKDTDERQWTDHVLESIAQMAKSEGHHWEVSLEHLERVKWYAPHVRHVVADVRCCRFEG